MMYNKPRPICEGIMLNGKLICFDKISNEYTPVRSYNILFNLPDGDIKYQILIYPNTRSLGIAGLNIMRTRGVIEPLIKFERSR